MVGQGKIDSIISAKMRIGENFLRKRQVYPVFAIKEQMHKEGLIRHRKILFVCLIFSASLKAGLVLKEQSEKGS